MSRTSSKEDNFMNGLWMDYQGFTLFKTDIIIDYLKEFENYLENKTQEIESKILEWQKSEKEHEYSGADYYEEDYLNYQIYYRQLKLESVFLSSYASFEHFLKNMTKSYQQYFDLQIGAEDLSGRNYIAKSKKYLEKVIGLNLVGTDSIWNLIIKYQAIRNKIVHNDSRIGLQDKNIASQIAGISGVSINNNKIILMNKDFIISFWKLFDEYIEKIFTATREKITAPNTVYN